MIFINVASAQDLVENGALIDSATVNRQYILLPTFEVPDYLCKLLEPLVKDCQLDEYMKSDKTFYLFYSKRMDSSFRVIIHPFLSPIEFDSNCYGMFKVQGKAFICCGNNAKDLFKKQTRVDSFLFALSRKANLGNNPVNGDKWEPDLYAPAQSISKKINDTTYNIIIQPCSDRYLRRRKEN